MKKSLDALIAERIDSLVKEVQTHVRAAALEAVRSALEGSDSKVDVERGSAEDDKRASEPKATSDHQPRGARDRARPASIKAADTPGSAPREPRSATRTTASTEIEKRLREFLRAHPGKRMEEIAREMGVDSAHLKPVMKRLVRRGVVRSRGTRRLTRYTLVSPQG
jgi:transcriptional regulator with GAF, ATPase, and Fis domain